MKYAIKMGMVVIIYIPSSIKIGSGINLYGEDTHTQTGLRLQNTTLGK
jgi:hypothetical protein